MVKLLSEVKNATLKFAVAVLEGFEVLKAAVSLQ